MARKNECRVDPREESARTAIKAGKGTFQASCLRLSAEIKRGKRKSAYGRACFMLDPTSVDMLLVILTMPPEEAAIKQAVHGDVTAYRQASCAEKEARANVRACRLLLPAGDAAKSDLKISKANPSPQKAASKQAERIRRPKQPLNKQSESDAQSSL